MKKRSKIIIAIIPAVIIVMVIGSLFLWWFIFQSPLIDNNSNSKNNNRIDLILSITNDSDNDHEIRISIWNSTSGFEWNFTCHIEKNSVIVYNKEIEPGETSVYIDFNEIDDNGNYHAAPKFGGRITFSEEKNKYIIHIDNGDYSAHTE